ncbi:TIGR03618 family F420-dependent PPOX class oxidoreductase [Micromonospora sp. WMMD1120]|uniref:TIGR03618 family F420-dependent PPOX class oxidoreductase n=1 Tax=Micromonospora sp. WMMD1120 TaxID=3016106 RepID=UPI00241779D5|nr:TIGR03618 family F420-dependent PPOX class oxidoreductase [Micromonospora sp. WMMD1120]MDG4809800.1 TIGR03618 family F420-dependent PPOX class oxidoreductase [Micromonospora sp. WMMD1120]
MDPTSPTLPPDVAARLATERNVWLCTLRRDGSPHLTPVWFVYADATFWISCGNRSVKARNVTADPRVSVALEGGDAPVVAEGAARVHRDGFPPPVVTAFAGKYDSWDIRRQVTPVSEQVLLEIPVHRWLLAGTAQ